MANRILSLKLENIKCVRNGTLSFSEAKSIGHGDLSVLSKASVLGLYGQNGSGKTASFNTFRILKLLALGVPLYPQTPSHPKPFSEMNYLLHADTKKGKIEYTFLIEANKATYKIIYQIELKKRQDRIAISRELIEVIPFHKKGEAWKYPLAPQIIDFEKQNLDVLYDGINHKKGAVKIAAESVELYSSLLATKLNCGANGQSYIFSQQNISYLVAQPSEKAKTFGLVLKELKNQLVGSLYTFKTNQEGLFEVGLGTLLGIHVDSKRRMILRGEFHFSTSPFAIPEEQFEAYEQFIEEINIFVSSFVPDFKLAINKLGGGSDKGVPFVNISINRVIGSSSIPLSQESAGIRKLISLTCALIYVYGNPNGWLVIDEFDSGVFEELLGQIVSVIQKNGKGQLLFTAHNLRPLERIPSDCVLFTTHNPNNRYIAFKNLSKTSNLRDCYFRALKLGGQAEELSSQVGDEEIDLALFEGYEALKKTGGLK